MTAASVSVARNTKRVPPGPKGNFLLGSLRDVSRDWLSFYTGCAKQYGDIVQLRYLHVPICLVVHPRDIEYVLVTNPGNFTKSADYRALARVLGKGLLTSEGKFWQRQRGLIQPTALQRALPQPVAPRAVAGRGRIETDRPGSRPQQRGSGAGVDDRARRGALQRRRGSASRCQRPAQIREHQGAHLGRRLSPRQLDARPRPLERPAQLFIGRPQPTGGAERDDQDIDQRSRLSCVARSWSLPSGRSPAGG